MATTAASTAPIRAAWGMVPTRASGTRATQQLALRARAPRGNGGFAVSVRSAEISGTEARIFAGVGVVADSDPQAELSETRSKFQAMLGALIRP